MILTAFTTRQLNKFLLKKRYNLLGVRKLVATFKNNNGFTLIEVAIGLIIVGLLTLPLIEAYRLRIEAEKQGFNNAQFSQITQSINQYVVDNGFYPVPASLLAGPTDAAYGTQAAAPYQPCPSWPTPNGICRTTGADQVFIGAVPIEDIGLNPEFALDYWGNKITYAVSRDQTGAYVSGAGIINTQGYSAPPGPPLVAPTGPPVLEPKADMDMILISHGETAAGAYTEDGNLVMPCPAVAAGLEFENCNFDNQFVIQRDVVDASATYLGPSGIVRNLGGGVSTNYEAGPLFYDDHTFEQVSVPVDLWFQHLTTADYAITLSSRIGVGTENPQAKVHVMGDMAANGVLSDSVCADGAADCFNPFIIAGDDPDMDCDTNSIPGREPVMNIGDQRVYCASPVDSGGNPIDGERFVFPSAVFSRINCADSGMLMRGIDASGDPICQVP